MAERMRAPLGQTIIVENVTGAAGTIGVGKVARAAPDGYTISIGHWGTHVVNGAIYRSNYDLLTDFEPVAMIASNPQIIVSKNAVPARNLQRAHRLDQSEFRDRTQGTAGYRCGRISPASIFEHHRHANSNLCPIAAPVRRCRTWWPGRSI